MRRRTILSLILGFILLICLIAARSWLISHPAITITTDSTPVKLELNDSAFVLNSSHKTLRPPKNIYNYKATYAVNGDTINLYGSVNTAANATANIVLNYKIFSRQSIKQALCQADGVTMENCGNSYTPLGIKFVDDHSWAVVQVKPSDELGPSVEILQLLNGSWQKIVGPSDPEDLKGLVPAQVLEAAGQ